MIRRYTTCPRDPAGSCQQLDRNCATCEIREGVPRTNGWGYYASRGGAPMLVVERRANQRIRINGAIDIIVLETNAESVRLGIEGASARNTHKGGPPRQN